MVPHVVRKQDGMQKRRIDHVDIFRIAYFRPVGEQQYV